MPDPSQTHPDYNLRFNAWQIMRDVSAGEEAVKNAGTRYLPMLGGQGKDVAGKARYEAYKSRPAFYNATGRTVDGLTGMVFRKAPEVEFPGGMEDFMEDVTLGGLDFEGFAQMSVDEVVTVGVGGVLVDSPRAEVGGLTQREAERMNLRPFLSFYKAESILAFRTGHIGNKTVLTQLRLDESVQERVDEFTEEEVRQIRVLDLDESLQYRQRIFRQDKNGEWFQAEDDIYPQMNGQPMDYIPFIFLKDRDTTPGYCKPPLIDLAYVNISHYKTSADLEHAAHFTALPTPWRAGVKEGEDVPNEIGPEVIWEFEDPSAKAELLEYKGEGIGALEKRAEKKEQQMASLGARMLAPEKRQAEAAETAAIHRQGEISVLASLAQAVSIGLTKALEIARDWMGLTEDVSVQLNTDYLPSRMSAQEMTAYLQALQQGGISHEAFIEAWREGERLRSDLSTEEEMERIDENAGGLAFGVE